MSSSLRGRNMPCSVRKRETCPAGFGRGEHALVRLGLQYLYAD